MNFKYQLRSTQKKDGTHAIRLKVSTSNKDIQYINTGISVLKNQWDNNKQKVKRHSLEEHLNADLTHIYNNVRILSSENRGVSAARLYEIYKNLKKYNSSSFIDFYQSIIDDMKLRDKYRSAKTNQIYLDKLKQYQSQIYFSDLNLNYANEYEQHLLRKGNKVNTIAANFKGIYATLNKAVKLGIIEKNPFKGYTIKTENARKTPLTFEEILRLQNYHIERRFKSMSVARDMFLFSFYTAGMRFTDLCKLKWDNIIGNDVVYTMNKSANRSGSRRTIPLSPKAIEILDKYKDRDRYIFPPLYKLRRNTGVEKIEYKIYIQSNKLNRSLKILAKHCGINKNISMHVAKHSFTDYAIKNEVGILMISKLLGHTKLATTEHYLRDFYHKEESDTINKLFG